MNLHHFSRHRRRVLASLFTLALAPVVCAQGGGGGAIGAGNIGSIIGNLPPGTNVGNLTNLSTLAKINNPGDLLIPGIVVAGGHPRTLLIRAVGPGLQDFGLATFLGDPRITVLNGTATVDTNNNWAQVGAAAQQAALTAVFPAVGAFPLKATNSDAALVAALPPAAYTLQAGAAPAGLQPATPPSPTGSVLVEVYEVP